MPDPNRTQLVEFRNWMLRARPASPESARLLMLLHGWTGNEDSMWVFVRNFPAVYWMVAPRAPYAARPSGFSWRQNRGELHDRPGFDDLRPSAETLIQLVDVYSSEMGVKAGSFDVIGFSQGAALANVLTLLYPNRIGRTGVLAGFMPPGGESLLVEGRLNSKPFFVAHGTQDEMVAIEAARQSVKILEQAGAHVTYCEDAVGHKLSVTCLHALERFFG